MVPRQAMILGGARSGKSTFAECLVDYYHKSKVYIATSQALDVEMQDRIDTHTARRGADWHTIEAPMDVATPLAAATDDQVILLDCATLWLSNQMLAGADLALETDRLIDALCHCAADIVVVSNEVGQGIVPDNQLARRFRDEQGRLNQRLAAAADLSVLVVAGLPLVLKGALPDGLT